MMWSGWFGLGIGAMALFMLIPLALGVFWIVMLIDCLMRPFKDKSEKLIWILVLIFTNILGALIYYYLVKRKK